MAQTYKGWIGKDLDTHGMAWAILVRERTPGWVELGAFLVDAWCLGVKDAYYDEIPADEVQALLDDQLPADMREEADPACVRKLVEGAVAYAQALGFLPHRDFRKARKVFGSIKATDCAREFIFGHEGKPCFMAGPDDDEARINRVLSILSARLGPEGFTFVDTAGEDDLTDEELMVEVLYRFIEDGGCPDKAFTGYEAYGFITGLWVQPDLVPPSQWIPQFWGGEQSAPVYRDAEEARAISAALMALYNQVGEDFQAGEYAIGLPEPDESDAAAMASRYCFGVLRGLGLRPAVLSWLRGHPEGAAAVALLERCSGGVVAAGAAVESDLVDAVTALRGLAGELPRLDSSRGL
jgi:yecA family protein